MKISLLIHFVVGLFVLLGLVAFVMIAVRVSGLNLAAAKDTYQLHAYFHNAAGLTERARVSISGVAIGRVEAIAYDAEELAARVTMRINQNVAFITRDASASILTSGLLGEKYIGIQLGADMDMLGDGDYIADTQSSVVLEDLLGKFLLNKTQ